MVDAKLIAAALASTAPPDPEADNYLEQGVYAAACAIAVAFEQKYPRFNAEQFMSEAGFEV